MLVLILCYYKVFVKYDSHFLNERDIILIKHESFEQAPGGCRTSVLLILRPQV